MEQVYIAAIIATAIVITIIAVAVIYRDRLREGYFQISRKIIKGNIKNYPKPTSQNPTPTVQQTPRQDGKTVVDDTLMAKSDIRAPRDADFKVRKSKLFGSKIDIYDSSAEESRSDDAT